MNKSFLITGMSVWIMAASCTSHKPEEAAPQQLAVTKPLVVDTIYNKEYIAQLQSMQNVELRAQEKGYLQNIYVDEGQYVYKGQLLFRIMPSVYNAEYDEANAEARTAQLEMKNTQILADKDIVSQNELAISKAKYEQAKAAANLAAAHLSFTEIRAPFNGTIDRIKLKQGSLIDEGALLTSISDNESIYAYFNVSESEYLNYKTDTANRANPDLTLLLANGDTYKYPGHVETIESEFDNTTGNIFFRAKFPNPDQLLKHGETGKVFMSLPVKNAIVIPQKATYELQDKYYVYVLDNNNKVHSKNVTIKYELPNIYVLDSGLQVGETILLDGLQTVKEDEIIKPAFADPDSVMQHLQLIQP